MLTFPPIILFYPTDSHKEYVKNALLFHNVSFSWYENICESVFTPIINQHNSFRVKLIGIKEKGDNGLFITLVPKVP